MSAPDESAERLESLPYPADFEAAERYLVSLPSFGMQVFRRARGLDRSFAYLRELGDPQDAVRTVHVAGTAGKGSVAYGIAAALSAGGRSVGLHVSPHVYDLRERFQHDGRLAEEAEVVAEARRSLDAARRLNRSEHGPPTFFEATVGVAFSLFRHWAVDYAVVEVGLGGLLDGTNTVRRSDKLAVVTSIGLDHTAVLGETHAEIALQKAGIFPYDGTALVSEPERDDVLRAFEGVAAERRTTLVRVPPIEAADLPMHMRSNLALVEEAVRFLARRDGWDVDPALVRRAALARRMPGRFERLSTEDGRVAVLDGSHNPMKVKALLDTMRAEYGPRFRAAWVVACKEEKDAPGVMAEIAPHADTVVATQFEVPRGDSPSGPSLPAEALAAVARSAGVPSVARYDRLVDAVGAVAAAPLGVVTGSFLYLGQAKAHLRAKGYAELE